MQEHRNIGTAGRQVDSRALSIVPPMIAAELLVSVRDASEAAAAAAGGAHWVDVKEPNRGSLGRPEAATIWQVVKQLAGRVPVSVALGELAEKPRLNATDRAALVGVRRVKVGLAGCRDLPAWAEVLRSLASSLPPTTSMVAVHYADWRTCRAPGPEEVLELAGQLGCSALLVDTYDKRAGRLFDWFTEASLAELLTAARAADLSCVVAGSLTAADFGDAIATGADILAVRGAACRDGDRAAQLCSERVAALRRQLEVKAPLPSRSQETTKIS